MNDLVFTINLNIMFDTKSGHSNEQFLFEMNKK